MNISEPIVSGTGRYRIHRVRSGFHICFQAEWQRDYNTLRRERLQAKDGTVIEFFALPCWEASAWLFDNAQAAASFAKAALEGTPVTNDRRSVPPGSDLTDAF